MMLSKRQEFSLVPIAALLVAATCFVAPGDALAQSKKRNSEQLTTIQGVIKNDARKRFRVDYEEIKTSLRKVVVPPPPPFPDQWEDMKPAAQQKWLKEFTESPKGKTFLENRQKLLNAAPVFDVKYNEKGDFTVYDVPPGEYGLQGRIDKEIDGVTYGFEVYAVIKVTDDVDHIKLEPIPVEITPILKAGQLAPEFSVRTSKDETLSLDLEAYKDRYIFLNFMNTTDVAPGYQQSVQQMYQDLGKSHDVKLITIVLDDKPREAIKWLVDNKLTKGSFGFSDGWDHQTVRNYGVRSTPSGWLLSPDEERKIVMSQFEFFQLARVKDSVTAIIRDRIDGEDTPTLATPEGKKDESEEESNQ